MKLRKTLCLLLAVLTVGSLFAGCSGKTEDPVQTGGTTESTESTETEATEELPDVLTADYEDTEFRILSAGNAVCEDFTFTEESSLPLDNAQYKRKVKVEEDFGVQIIEDTKKAYSSGAGPGFTAVSQAVNAGDCVYDLCLIAGYDVSVLAYNGYLYDMNSIPKLDLKKSWWDQEANRTLNVKGVMFFTTGDITVSDNNATFCMMFNKELLKQYGLESPYDMVDNNTWTIEKFAKICKTVTEDLNQDGVMDQNDRFGLLVWDDSICGIVNAAGQRCCTINDEGTIELTIYTEDTLSALEQYFTIAYDTQYAFTYQRKVSSGKPLWKNGQALFFTSLVGDMPFYREMENDFGILPYPKLTETQEHYYSTIAPYNSQFICVPLIQDDIDRTGIVTEALAYYGQQIVTPAYYDVTLIGQSSRDEESEAMLDLIFDHLVFDIGYLYQIGPYNKQLILMVREYNTNFTSVYETYKTPAETLLSVINEYYAKAVSEWQ